MSKTADLTELLNDVYNKNRWEIEEHEGGKVHNWLTYLPDELSERWEQLTPEIKAAVYLTCKPIAQNEEWD